MTEKKNKLPIGLNEIIVNGIIRGKSKFEVGNLDLPLMINLDLLLHDDPIFA